VRERLKEIARDKEIVYPHGTVKDSKNIDEWFSRIRAKYAAKMQCAIGCTACCYGLFDISLADAVEVARGFQNLLREAQDRVRAKAESLHDLMRRVLPDVPDPLILADDDSRIDRIVDGVKSPACPCLGDMGECLIYEHRPVACRLEGVPMVDVHDGPFGDWCDLNFKDGVSPAIILDLQQDYSAIDTTETVRSAAVARTAGLHDSHSVTFIPSVIAQYDRFWKRQFL
jgi:hypothetical protein